MRRPEPSEVQPRKPMKMFAQLTWTLARLHLLPLDTGYCTLPATGHSTGAAGATVASECQDTLSSMLFSIRSLVWGSNCRPYGWLSVVFVIAKANEKLTVPRCFSSSRPLLRCLPRCQAAAHHRHRKRKVFHLRLPLSGSACRMQCSIC